jgi:hypothetical protein
MPPPPAKIQRKPEWGATGISLQLAYLLGQELLAQPKVCEHNVALGVQQYVLQLQVPIDDVQLARARGTLGFLSPGPSHHLHQVLTQVRRPPGEGHLPADGPREAGRVDKKGH